MKSPPVLHPYFFAAYAVLGVYSQRPHEIPIIWVVRPTFFILGIFFLIQLGLKKTVKDEQRAGFIVTLILAWLFSGHLRNTIYEVFFVKPTFAIDVFLIFSWGVLLTFLGSIWLWKRIKQPELLTNFLNVTSWVVIILPLYFVFAFTRQAIQQNITTRSNGPLVEPVFLTDPGETSPDIYVIILDAYGREDFLHNIFLYDNSRFISFLEERGFYIGGQSRPNYPQTQLSLASLLNFQYLTKWSKGLESTNNREPLNKVIRHSEVHRALEEIGYQIINIPNSTLISDNKDSNVYLPMLNIEINQFEGLLIATTSLEPFIQEWDLKIPVPSHEMHRRTILYQFKVLKSIPLMPGKKFVYVHILAPHPPFVFDSKGKPVEPPTRYTLADGEGFPGTLYEYQFGYSEEIEYLNAQLMEVVSVILVQSANPPIIIIQGDHGPGSRFGMVELELEECLWERYSILNAYYFPGQNYDSLYPSITPVNSFRIIFNTFFGESLPLLDDRSFYATYAAPYLFHEVTDQITEETCPAK